MRIAKLCDSVDMSLQHRHCLHYYYYYHLRYNQYLLVKKDERREKWPAILLRLFFLVECTQLSFVRIKTNLRGKKR